MKKDEKITKQLERKKERLEQIVNSEMPINEKLWDAHKRKEENARRFLVEIEEIEGLLEADTVKVVPISTFNKVVEKADYATMEFDGEFCKVATITNFPYEDNVVMVYLASIEKM